MYINNTLYKVRILELLVAFFDPILPSHSEKDRFRSRSVVINPFKPSGHYMYHHI